jgi:hypothetical protein
MHKMHISTTQVSSVMLRSKKVEIRKKLKTVCHEIEPNLSKDRALPEGDNALFENVQN